MVLTNAHTTAFFEAAAQMGIPRATVVQLVNEGISTVHDLLTTLGVQEAESQTLQLELLREQRFQHHRSFLVPNLSNDFWWHAT
jgi:predicted DNA-binding protein (UPF0251 family)